MIGNNEILNYLLIKEDFLPEPTDLGDGKITIGSGLTDSKWIDLYKKRGNKWSKEDNRKAVLEEIQKRRLWAEQNVPHWNSLPESSQDALLSYRYNYNFTPKNSPKLFKALEDKNYLEAAKQIDATSKNPDFKNGLLKRRKEEQQWFLSGFPELSKPNDFAIPYKYPAPEYPTAAEAYRKNMAPITDNYSQGGQLQNHKQWKDLSYSEKNDIIKVAVRNGITTLPEIRQKYNEFANEGNLYAGGGYVYDMLPQLFASDGVQVRVTSGYRPNSRVQGSGKPSRHSMHEAADIVGDFSTIRRVLDNPESNTAKWMRANGYGYLDETSKTGTKKFWHDQKGDHSHYHIGKDSGIAKKFAASTGITSNAIPIVSTGNYLDIAKAHIRNNEGWSPVPVADGPKNTGWRSVGYGFNDSGFRAKYPQGISKAYENGITKAQAEQELDYILGNMDSHLRRVYGSKWNSFNDNQKAAILDTYYQRPASVVGRNSAFYNAVMRGDNNAVNYLGVAGYNTRNNDRRKLFSSTVTQMPEDAQTVQQPLFYQPWNPQAANLYTPYSPLTPYPAPIFSPEEQEEYFAKQIAQAQKQQEAEQREKQRQEKVDRINRFSLLMNLTDPYSSDNSSSSSTPFADAVNMLTQRSPISYFSNGGSIFIKPENRGKFTRLKERTGHSASWFKENGTPEQKKMAIFALNSKHWKHGLGGNLFEDGGDTKANIPVTYFTQSEAMPLLADNPNRTAVLDEVTVKPYKKLPMQSELFQGITNQAANEKADEYADRTSLTPGRFLGLMGANVPLAAGALGATVAAPALFDSTVAPLSDYITGSSIAGVPTTTWLNTGIEAGFAGHGLNHAVNENINGWGDAAMTALEVAPLGKLARPMWNAGRNNLGLLKDDAKAFYNNLTMDLNSVPGRFYHGSPSRTIEEFIPGDSGGIYFTPTKRAARGYTGSLGTGRVYEANLNLGDSPVVVDAGGKAWNAIPEKAVEKAFGMPKEEIYEQIGHYNSGAEPWYSDFLKPFGYRPNTRSYAVDQIVTLGKDLGKSSLTIKGARDSGKGLFGWRQLPYDQIIVYSPEQISLLEKSYPIKSAPTITAENTASMTPMELTPLGRLAKPVYEGIVQPGMRLFNSPLTGKWTKIGNREYRLNPNSLGVNGNSLESRAITPQITAENTSNYSSIMADADDFSYKGLSSIKSDMEKIIYNNKIHGKPMYPSDEGITGFSKNVQTGVPKTEYNELLHDVIGRNVREFKRAGLNDAQVSDYINNAKNAMDNVHIGMYSNSDYIKGGWGGFGGFYDSEGNFISVNTGSPLSKTKVVKHEGRHLLDHKVDDEILMPTSESFGNNFDSDVVLSTMQKVKQNQNMILYDAYDNDFITLPNKKGFNDGLEGYSNMGREAITTNLDSRNTLLGSKAGLDFDTTDKIIDKMPDAAIFEAVEKANGYGKRFIKFLRENNKLTPKKAQQFREAMKHVGAYAAPVGIALGTSAATLYNKSK